MIVLLSIMLAALGVNFAYYLSLPAALHFLSQIGSESITPLLSANEYVKFVSMYLVSLAILFQLPVIVAITYTIRPFGPGSMMQHQRHVILASFIAAAILTPTPDPIHQAIMAAPTIALYQVAVIYVWIRHRPTSLLAQSAKKQATPQLTTAPVSPTLVARTNMKAAPPTQNRTSTRIHNTVSKTSQKSHLIQDIARPQPALSRALIQ
jgi:sec-independent protein translocase protein TatC